MPAATKRVVALLIVGALAGVGWYYFRARSHGTVDHAAQGKTALVAPPLPMIVFTDITDEAGIAFSHTRGAAGEKLLPETMGAGVAFFDYNNDGHQDLLFLNGMPWPWQTPTAAEALPTLVLYENDGQGRFRDMTQPAGLAIPLYGMGVAAGDYDGDGWTDLFLTAVGTDKLLRNDAGKFQDVTMSAKVAGPADAWSTAACWFDYDRDGWLDLLVCDYVQWSRQIDVSQGFTLTGRERAYGPPLYFAGTHCRLYRNEGNGSFTDVSQAAGIAPSDAADDHSLVGKALGVVPHDLDGDGWLDLVVANDTERNFLFHNRQIGTFEEIGSRAGIARGSDGQVRGAMGIDIASPRNDGSIAIAIGNFTDEPTSYFVSQTNGAPLLFADESQRNGLAPQTEPYLTFAVLFFDADLDGRLDILATNGHLEDEINKVMPSQHYRQPPQLLWNAGVGQSREFVALPADKVGNDFARPLVGRGAAVADIDSDGDIDVVITESGGRPRLLRNDQQLGQHWLRVKLHGQSPNREALGAIVQLHAAGTVQQRSVNPTRGYLSQSELPVTFGLGEISRIDRVTVTWPDGTEETIVEPSVDQCLEIRQGAAAR